MWLQAQVERGTKSGEPALAALAGPVKGTEDYNLASDEDCRRGEQGVAEGRGPPPHAQQQDMPTWTFYEKEGGAPARTPAAAGPQSAHSPRDRNREHHELHEDEVVCSKM